MSVAIKRTTIFQTSAQRVSISARVQHGDDDVLQSVTITGPAPNAVLHLNGAAWTFFADAVARIAKEVETASDKVSIKGLDE